MNEPELRLEAYTDNELQEALKELFSFEEFVMGMQSFLPKPLFEHILKEKDGMRTILDFQRVIIRPFLLFIKDISISEITASGLNKLEHDQKYLFISNHRDIVLDSAFLNMVLLKNGFETCQIAIGDNLMKHRLSELLFRVNKSFVVKRTGTPRELYAYSLRMSEYIKQLITTHTDSVWLAQREGRAKDGNDLTQIGVLKMLSLSKTDQLKKHFQGFKIVPVAISYEIDPCDLLKTREHLRKQLDPCYKKAFQDDVDYIYQGLKGPKGHLHISFNTPLNTKLNAFDELGNDKKKLFFLSQQIDRAIHKSYRLHPINYIAHDLMTQSKANTGHYSATEFDRFKQYFDDQIQQLKPAFRTDGMKYLLGIYANPLINALKE